MHQLAENSWVQESGRNYVCQPEQRLLRITRCQKSLQAVWRERVDLSILGGKLEKNHHFTVTTESSI